MEGEPCEGHREMRLAGGEADRDHHLPSVPLGASRMSLHTCIHLYMLGELAEPFHQEHTAKTCLVPGAACTQAGQLWVVRGSGQDTVPPLHLQVSLLYNNKGFSVTEMSDKLEKIWSQARWAQA